jgi:site-specific recombinase XerD
MITNSVCIRETKKALEEYLLSLGYSSATIDTYQWVLSRLDKFMTERGETNYTTETGKVFLEKELNAEHYPSSHLKHTRIAIRRLNDFIAGEFTLVLTKNAPVPDCYTQYFHGYLENLRLQGLRESTVKEHYYSCSKMLRILYSLQIHDLSKIQSQNIYDVFTKSNDKKNISASLRSFLRYLFKSGILAYDFSVFVPSVRGRKPIPSVYTKDETSLLLSSIDKTQHAGKRDYAIILLALRLGIRSGDIANLKIQDINFQSNTIDFIQGKTHVPQRLELLPELKESIHIYLSEARPETEHPNIFISIRPPFRPITVMGVTSLITRCMKRSGILIGSRSYGGHALRMTLASELVSEKVPYQVVRKILGHEDTKSMKHYVKFDTEMLRFCALEVPLFTGLYANYIKKRTEGGRK